MKWEFQCPIIFLKNNLIEVTHHNELYALWIMVLGGHHLCSCSQTRHVFIIRLFITCQKKKGLRGRGGYGPLLQPYLFVLFLTFYHFQAILKLQNLPPSTSFGHLLGLLCLMHYCCSNHLNHFQRSCWLQERNMFPKRYMGSLHFGFTYNCVMQVMFKEKKKSAYKYLDDKTILGFIFLVGLEFRCRSCHFWLAYHVKFHGN